MRKSTPDTHTSSAALRANDIAIGYTSGTRGRFVIAEHLDLELIRGEVVCLVGPNGVGKSTLLRTITGLQPLLSGTVEVDDEDLHRLDVRARARKIGVVLTERISVGVLPAYDLVALGRHPHTSWSGRLTEEDLRVVEWALESVGASDLRDRSVNELSDGERQKIMIARALAQDPSIIVLDEPTAYLDLPRRVEIMGLLKRLVRTTDRAILLSTHDLDLAIRASDRIWLMGDGGEGRYIAAGAPEDLILASTFEKAFRGDGVEFDPNHGSFHLASTASGTVAVSGEGIEYIWTRRALEREGFRVVGPESAEADLKVTARDTGDESERYRWTVRRRAGDEVTDFGSLYDLMRSIRTP